VRALHSPGRVGYQPLEKYQSTRWIRAQIGAAVKRELFCFVFLAKAISRIFERRENGSALTIRDFV